MSRIEVKVGLLLVLALFIISFAGATTVSTSDISSTQQKISVSNAVDMYAYEVNFDFDGSISSVASANFLGSGSGVSYGYSTRGNVLSVYGSKLDSTKTGVSGSGDLFTVTHSGTLTMSSFSEIDSAGTSAPQSFKVSSGGGPSGGGGGGGGSPASVSITTTRIDFSADPEELNINVIVDRRKSTELKITNEGNTAVNVTLKVEGKDIKDIIRLSSENFDLAVGEEKIVNIDVVSTSSKILTGVIKVNTSGKEKIIPIVINSRSENFLFDTTISLPINLRKVVEGAVLNAQVNLLQVGPKEKIDVVATYIVKDYEGTVFFEESETFFVLDSKDYIKKIPVVNLPSGKYVLGLEIAYPGAFATSSTQFEVVGKEEKTNIFIIAIFIAIVGVIIIFVLRVLMRGRVAKLKKYRKV